ncbi:RND family transporter [Shewanella intestini]|uniref:RND transporter n=1 Tax=Shewanella intestini TaxID=2017544 RepID=A0ABS5I5W9_9GAMM|nr:MULTISPECIES: RND transporter [Shewanella]MBR9729424.1 RND transporter [Shewanella intestini]MRG37504.1 RND transporter [Shewanella sp. XMDDZSB0408]
MYWQQKLIHFSYKRPLLIFTALLTLLIWATLGIMRVDLDVNFNDYFAKDDQGFIGVTQLGQHFDRNDQFLMLLESPQSWLQLNRKQQLQHFISELNQDSLIDNVSGYADFINPSQQHSPILSYKHHPRLPLVLSKDSKAIILTLAFNQSDRHLFHNTTLWREHHIDRINALAQTYWQANDVNVFLNGTESLNWQYIKVLRHDLSWFGPGLAIIVVLMAMSFIRSRWWLAAIALNCMITLWVTLGVAGWFNLTLAAISAFIPVIVVTLSLAYSAHLYLGWCQRINTSVGERDAEHHVNQHSNHPMHTGNNSINHGAVPAALLNSFNDNRSPLFFATLTTTIGFALLVVSPSPPIQAFGILVAVAVVCHYILCHSLLVLLASKATTTSTKDKQATSASMAHLHGFASVTKLAQLATAHRKKVCALVLTLSALGAVSSAKLTLNDDPLSYFPDDNPFSLSHKKMQQYFYGINMLHYEVHTEPYAIYDKAYLSFLYKFSRYLKQQPEVKKVLHVGDWVKSSGLTASQFKRIVEHNTVAQLGVQAEISQGFKSSLMTLYLHSLSARQMVDFETKVNAWLIDNNPQLTLSPALSSNLLFAHLCLENAKSMLASFALALLLLSVILGMLKRSVVFAIVGLLLNFLPLLWMFGVWQAFGGFISLGSAVVLGIMLGIIVDDTLHLMLKLPSTSQDLPSHASSSTALNAPSPPITETEVTHAFWASYRHIIPVVTFTTLTLVLGFGIGLLSDFGPIAQLSLLSCIVISFAWIFDVLVLPVIYHWLIRRPL